MRREIKITVGLKIEVKEELDTKVEVNFYELIFHLMAGAVEC